MSSKRQLSEFLCREMLYDYAVGSLDEVRSRAVRDCLADFPELKDELEALQHGIEYVDHLATTQVTEPLIDSIVIERGIFAAMKKFSEWPAWVRWSLDGVFIAIVIFAAAMLVPDEFWMKDTSSWDVARVDLEKTGGEIGTSEKLDQEEIITRREEAMELEAHDTGEKVEQKEVLAKKPEESESDENLVKNPSPPENKGARVGFLYRMYMFSDRVDEITPIISKKIVSMGGKKAGQVKLGWRKKMGSYFHFTLPSDKNAEITKFVSQFGDVRVSKDEHKRVMPEGIHRFILWVEEKNPKPRGGNGSATGN